MLPDLHAIAALAHPKCLSILMSSSPLQDVQMGQA